MAMTLVDLNARKEIMPHQDESQWMFQAILYAAESKYERGKERWGQKYGFIVPVPPELFCLDDEDPEHQERMDRYMEENKEEMDRLRQEHDEKEAKRIPKQLEKLEEQYHKMVDFIRKNFMYARLGCVDDRETIMESINAVSVVEAQTRTLQELRLRTVRHDHLTVDLEGESELDCGRCINSDVGYRIDLELASSSPLKVHGTATIVKIMEDEIRPHLSSEHSMAVAPIVFEGTRASLWFSTIIPWHKHFKIVWKFWGIEWKQKLNLRLMLKCTVSEYVVSDDISEAFCKSVLPASDIYEWREEGDEERDPEDRVEIIVNGRPQLQPGQNYGGRREPPRPLDHNIEVLQALLDLM
jgi:hypothetical protein